MDREMSMRYRPDSRAPRGRVPDWRIMGGRLVRVLTTRDVLEGAIARSRLEDEGIPVMTNGGEGPYRMGPVHLFVPVEFEVQARLVLDTVRGDAEGAPDERRRELTSDGDELAEPEERA